MTNPRWLISVPPWLMTKEDFHKDNHRQRQEAAGWVGVAASTGSIARTSSSVSPNSTETERRVPMSKRDARVTRQSVEMHRELTRMGPGEEGAMPRLSVAVLALSVARSFWMMRKAIGTIAAAFVAVIGFATTSQAATIAATSGGLPSISVYAGDTFVVDITVDTRGDTTTGYNLDVTWDGGPVPLLTVANPALDNSGDIVELDPQGATCVSPSPPGRPGCEPAVETYIPSAASSSGRISAFAAGLQCLGLIGDVLDHSAVARITFKALPPGPTPALVTIRPAFVSGTCLAHIQSCLQTTIEPLTVRVFPVGQISATKSDTQLTDEDGGGDVDPGDTLRYSIVIANVGEGVALTVVFTDTPDGNAPLIPGTVTTTQGLVLVGNAAGDTDVFVQVETIRPGEDATVTFDAVLLDPVPDGVEFVSNQGLVTSYPTLVSLVPTDDPDTPAAGDATQTAVVSALETCRENPAFLDADGDGEHDRTDRCPATAPGAMVDDSGCSLAQFCGSFDPRRDGYLRGSCNNADWRNDQPLGAHDCLEPRGVCLPR